MTVRLGTWPAHDALARRANYRWWVVGTVCVGAFLGQLDASIVSLALPTLEHVFNAPIGAIEWVAVAYLLTLASVVVGFGRLADLVGRKALYTLGFAVFILGSALCGAASSLAMLIGARILQAIGAAMLQANSVAIITKAVGRDELGRALGIQAAAQAIGLSVGPAVGGVLIATLGWRWVFYVAVPAGLLGMILGLLVLPSTQGQARGQRFDWGGAATFGPTIALVVYLLSGPAGTGGPPQWPLLVVAAGLAATFLFIETHVPAPLVDLGLFRTRAFNGALASGLLVYMVLFGVLFLVPFFLERVWAESSAQAGLLLMTVPLGLALAAPASGWLADRGRLRLITIAGMALTLLGLALLTRLGPEHGAPVLTTALGLLGLGIGLFLPANTTAIMASAPSDRLGVVGGIVNMTRGLGTALGIAATGVVLTTRLSLHAGRAAVGTTDLASGVLLAGFRETVLFLALLAVLAAAASLLRGSVAPGSADSITRAEAAAL